MLVFFKELLHFRNGNSSSASFNKIVTRLTVNTPSPFSVMNFLAIHHLMCCWEPCRSSKNNCQLTVLLGWAMAPLERRKWNWFVEGQLLQKLFHWVSYNYSISQIKVKGLPDNKLYFQKERGKSRCWMIIQFCFILCIYTGRLCFHKKLFSALEICIFSDGMYYFMN